MSTITSALKFRKEFEDIILKGNLDEALKTLPPEIKSYIEFCEEYKKCCESKIISDKLHKLSQEAGADLYKSLGSDKYYLILMNKIYLLEYELKSTSHERKKEIIEELFDNYCDKELDYKPPYFVREKKADTDEKNKAINSTPILLTEKMINEAVLKIIDDNKKYRKYEIEKTPENRRHILFLKYLDKKDYELCMDIINSNIKIPFYLINKDEFSKIIEFFNKTQKNMNNFSYNLLTIEQIILLLEKVTNTKYINKNELISILINKNYNKLIKRAKKENNLKEVKNILWKIYDIYQKFSPINASGILLYILKLNKQENIYDIKPLIEYLKAPLKEVFYSYQAKDVYNNKLVNEKLVYISSLSDIF